MCSQGSFLRRKCAELCATARTLWRASVTEIVTISREKVNGSTNFTRGQRYLLPWAKLPWEQNPVTGQNTEVPAYVDYINADGTPHINYNYYEGLAPPAPTQAQMQLAQDRNVQVYAQQGMFDPKQQPVQLQSWRPSWIQF